MIVLLTIFAGVAYNIIIVYILEVYSTRIRGAASSFTFILGRIFTAFVPLLLLMSFEAMDSGPFIFYGILCLIGLILGLALKFETNQRELDTLLS